MKHTPLIIALLAGVVIGKFSRHDVVTGVDYEQAVKMAYQKGVEQALKDADFKIEYHVNWDQVDDIGLKRLTQNQIKEIL